MAKSIRQKPLILASSSPRRRQLLRKLKRPFRVVLSDIHEDMSERDPVRLVRSLARQKAEAVAKTLKSGLVLGADTVVVFKHHIMSKPESAAGAREMLARLAGTTHFVYTGVALIDVDSGKRLVSHARSAVRMKKMPEEQLFRLARKHLDKAGAYAIQEKRDPIARVIRGSYDNVVGLPVNLVKRLLKRISSLP